MGIIDIHCLNQNNWKTDSETGCSVCDDYATYEACRQSFYLNKQAEAIKQNQSQVIVSTDNEQEMKDLEYHNLELQKINEQQSQQIISFLQSSEQTAQRMAKLNLINTILIASLVIAVCVLGVVKLMKQKNKMK